MALDTNQKKSTIAVMSALAVEVAFNRWIVPGFEAATGLKLDISWDPTTVLMRRIGEGERADVIVAIDNSMDKLVEEGIVRADSRVAIAQAIVGVAVKEGAPRPDISTVDAFKNALKGARAVAYSKGGASGIYFAGLIERLGISQEINANAVTIPAGFTAEKVASGEAELAIQQISELMSVSGVDIVGPFPDELQVATNFSAAIFADAANPEGAATFMQELVSKDADAAYRNGGLVSRLNLPAAA